MTQAAPFHLSGIATPREAIWMLEQIAEHFTEHADVVRTGDMVMMTSESGTTAIRRQEDQLLIELQSQSQDGLQLARTMLAEHLFYFSGEEPLSLTWSAPAPLGPLPNLHHVTVTAVETVTPRMRRVTVACPDVRPFVGADMHVRILVPPKGRAPVWPGTREDGRIAWPKGEDELLVRVYTIRGLDAERGEIWLDFFQHPEHDVATPGADFARDAQPGDRLALLGPGGGDRPEAASQLLIGDESALPAILRIIEEAAPTTRLEAIVEISDKDEEQQVRSAGEFSIAWIHRNAGTAAGGRPAPHAGARPAEKTPFMEAALAAISGSSPDRFVWIACEKDDVRRLRQALNAKGHDKKLRYVAWYWERERQVGRSPS
ncbi:siderophore-interacting protein [Rhizobium sp. SSA_523]|uniref:siderophore-interacting protein n=1 Tax=Rhizobium sp. SSA_523 TaxID=2952477 RepID=UPI002091DBA2|nr:siderophore-interacting protein [Rhizobium sp. SSA_523]MCO5733223.1 siderophore-interacting protein [Rhizobium sp. SSA_523]WKC21790.1 siderophore-interacting protein [Rhizobium sp. SSA_523]